MANSASISAPNVSTGAKCADSLSTKNRLLEATNDESEVFFSTYAERCRLHDNEKYKLPPPLRKPTSSSPYVDYDDLTGYSMPGMKVISHKKESMKKLKFERGMRATASGLGSVLSLGATLGLFYSGAKTVGAMFSGNDQEDANKVSANSFALTAIAGAGNALAQENVNWGLGSVGMGFLGRYLDKPAGLALFSIFDGLNAIGMGQVKLRDQKNVIPLDNSIFDKPGLKNLQFLKQYEYAVKNFFQKLFSPRGWKEIKTSAPYDLYYAAGGGLISGGAALGVASMFSKWMSDSAKSLLYLPYSLTSLVNLVALGRDGAITKQKVVDYNDLKPIERKATILEGWAKLIASPIIALNYVALAAKGVGFDVMGSSETVSSLFRRLGVATAYVGFAAQSGIKLLNPDDWGPKVKHIVEVLLNPKIVTKYLMGLINQTKEKELEENANHLEGSDYFYPGLMRDEFANIFDKIINTTQFKQLDERHLTGLPSEMAMDRASLKRGRHSIRVGKIGAGTADSIIENNQQHSHLFDDPAVRLGMKLAPLIHDVGHSFLPRCHLAETAFPMRKDENDHLSMESLNEGSEIYNAVVEGCIEKYGEEKGRDIAIRGIKNAIAILGHNSIKVEAVNPETGQSEEKVMDYRYKQLTDMADYMRSKGSDYPVSFNMPAWGKDEYEHYSDQVRVFEDKNGKIKFGFTEEGAITTFKHVYYRLLFNAFLNSHPVTLAVESAYKSGARQTGANLPEVYKMSDYELDGRTSGSVEKIHAKSRQVIRNVFGGSKAYAGYGPKDTIYVVRDRNGKQETYEFLDYFHKVLKNENPEAYDSMKRMVDVVTDPTLLEVILNLDPDAFTDEISEDKAVAGFVEDYALEEASMAPRRRTAGA